ncbi:MAG: AlpA family phage regulatory protein [Roseibium sp.]|uniref:helix-turn-helix transcriptional regulator n=1 Tax=Roseibium sp. TaxID=1936156 RepID=UPI001B0161A0|nr:AlpA family phage regulatory protein [Roseibium sp.]MBO6891605.1 AlpA family phage regulatory protein [Roseibium sp.]MBO6931648.1 AlpA family phage regulatory protein [Roseibium sp.]
MCAARQTELFPAIDPSTLEAPSEKKPKASPPARPASAQQKAKSKQSGTGERRSPKKTDVLSPWMAVGDVATFFAVSKPTIWRWTKNNPEFPKGHELSHGTTRWYRAEIEDYCLKLRSVNS